LPRKSAPRPPLKLVTPHACLFSIFHLIRVCFSWLLSMLVALHDVLRMCVLLFVQHSFQHSSRASSSTAFAALPSVLPPLGPQPSATAPTHPSKALQAREPPSPWALCERIVLASSAWSARLGLPLCPSARRSPLLHHGMLARHGLCMVFPHRF